jgi:NTP pyrophosphatase (non-canonical NTP hydrolase)
VIDCIVIALFLVFSVKSLNDCIILDSMDLPKMQKDVDEWTSQFTPQYWAPLSQLARLVEEVGELSREMNHVFGDKKKKESELENTIGHELADLLFTISCIANSNHIDLGAEWDRLMKEKQYGRDKDRFVKKDDTKKYPV